MPRVLIDLRMVRNRLHGMARYALELAQRLPTLAPEMDFIGLCGPDGLPEDLGPLAPQIPLVKSSGAFLSLREQPGLLASLLKVSPDLFHATSFSLPALWTGSLVATLHDANHLALANQYGPSRAAYYRWVVRPRALKAKALLTVSTFSQGELSAHLKIPVDRFQVIPNGVDPRFHRRSPDEVRAFQKRRKLPERYLLAVGNEKPFKNLGLLAALSTKFPLPLVLAAGVGVARKYGFGDSTVELPPLPEEELPLLYSGAFALLFPSKYEGFGLPAAEAMACGCPVLASSAGALPEVVADAGRLLPKDNPAAWVEAIQRLWEDPSQAEELVRRGLARVTVFGWDACARKTAEVYRQVLWDRSAKSA